MKKIVALVSLFNPNKSVAKNIEKLSEQVTSVVLTDNTPKVNNSKLFGSIKNAVYIANQKNLGLSAAFNKCMELDVVEKSDFIIFFDQDSCISEKYIEKLVTDFEILRKKINIGVLGPQYFDTSKNKIVELPKNSKEIEKGCFEVSEVITSSMLTKYEILKTVNFWNENVFLDYADFDLCWRAKSFEFKICQDCNVHLSHTLGKNSRKMYLPFKNKYVIQNYWSPFRYYYQTRDSIKLFWKKYVPNQWRKNFLIHNTIEILMHLYYLPQKKERLFYYCHGIIDGILGINGAIK
ncbi:MAG: glycosyltransferase [Spirochaetia bacterium]|nr:glycosyltransferase [Spirochaetia bacterium]